MKWFLVYGVMFNKIVCAEDASKVEGVIIRELSKEEAERYVREF